MVAAGEDDHRVAGVEFREEGAAFGGRRGHRVVPEMAAGNEARRTVLPRAFGTGDEEAEAVVAVESVHCGCGMKGVVNYVVAVEDLRFCAWTDTEDNGVV